MHVISCNARGYATKRHDGVAGAWERFVDMAGGDQLAPREFAPFGEGDRRRIDSLFGSVPKIAFPVGVDYVITSALGASALRAGSADRPLAAAKAAENDKRGTGNAMVIDMHAAGLAFLPVAHEHTGALGPAALKELFEPLLARVRKDEALRSSVRAKVDALELPWNARSLRSWLAGASLSRAACWRMA